MLIQNFHQIYSRYANLPTRDDWDTPVIPWEKERISEMSSWLDNQKLIFKSVRKPPIPLDEALKLAGPEQKLAYKFITKHHQQELKSSECKPLRLILHGIAGTGKSFLLQMLRQKLKKYAFFSATTGAAVCVIEGRTIHSLLALPTRAWHQKPLTSLHNLQERWRSAQKNPSAYFLFIAEMSMLGQKALYWIDQRARQATGHADELFGGLSVVLCGDFGQLPPVKDQPMYRISKQKYKKHIHVIAESLFKSFTTVIVLKKTIELVHKTKRISTSKNFWNVFMMGKILNLTGTSQN
jgi:hypothetical protein